MARSLSSYDLVDRKDVITRRLKEGAKDHRKHGLSFLGAKDAMSHNDVRQGFSKAELESVESLLEEGGL